MNNSNPPPSGFLFSNPPKEPSTGGPPTIFSNPSVPPATIFSLLNKPLPANTNETKPKEQGGSALNNQPVLSSLGNVFGGSASQLVQQMNADTESAKSKPAEPTGLFANIPSSSANAPPTGLFSHSPMFGGSQSNTSTTPMFGVPKEADNKTTPTGPSLWNAPPISGGLFTSNQTAKPKDPTPSSVTAPTQGNIFSQPTLQPVVTPPTIPPPPTLPKLFANPPGATEQAAPKVETPPPVATSTDKKPPLLFGPPQPSAGLFSNPTTTQKKDVPPMFGTKQKKAENVTNLPPAPVLAASNTVPASTSKPTQPLFGDSSKPNTLFPSSSTPKPTEQSASSSAVPPAPIPPPPAFPTPSTSSLFTQGNNSIFAQSQITPTAAPNTSSAPSTAPAPNTTTSNPALQPSLSTTTPSAPPPSITIPAAPAMDEHAEQQTPSFRPTQETSQPSSNLLSQSISIEIPAAGSLNSDHMLRNLSKADKQKRVWLPNPQEVLERICNLAGDESRLKEYANSSKQVTNFIFLGQQNEGTITTDVFQKLATSDIKNWEQMNRDVKKNIYDLFVYFCQQTRVSDWRSMQALCNFLRESDYTEKLVLKDGTNNNEYLRTLYELSSTGEALRLNSYSEEVNRIMAGILSELSNNNRISVQCIGMLQRNLKKSTIGQALSKDKLYETLWLHYFGIIDRVNEVRVRENNPPFIQRYYIEQKFQQLMLVKLLVVLAEEFRQLKLVGRSFLSKLIGKLETYRPLEDVPPEIRTMLRQSTIEQYHQKALVFLLELDRVRAAPSKGLVWFQTPSLEREIAKTSSFAFAPFRQILFGVNKLLFNKEFKDEKSVGCKSTLKNVNSQEWADWMELFILKHATDGYVEDLEAIVRAISKVYTTPASLDKAWKRSEPKDQPSNLIKFVRRMRDGDLKLRYTLLSTLVGCRHGQHVRDVVGSELFAESEWQPQIFRSMAGQIGEYERSRLSEAAERQKHLAFLAHEKKQINAKITFFLKVLELQPNEACSIETHFFGRIIEKNMLPETQAMPAIKTLMFLVDCLRFYSKEPHLDYTILKHIFRAINSISSCGNNQLSSTLYVVLGLSASFEPGIHSYYPYLGFMEKLNNNLNSVEGADELLKELQIHLDILLCDVDLMKVLPDESNRSRDSYESIRIGYNNRYSLNPKQFKDLLDKSKVRSMPESTWVRTILEVVKIGPMDFSLLARILKKFLIRPTKKNEHPPRLLQLIANSLKDLKMVEAVITTLEVSSVGVRQNYLKIATNPFSVQNNTFLNTWFEADPVERLRARQRIQDALNLLFVLLNLSHMLLRNSQNGNPLSRNFVVQLLKSMKFSDSIDRYFLSKHSLYKYMDQADLGDANSINVVQTLFYHLNFELHRAQTLETNTSLRNMEANGLLDSSMWKFSGDQSEHHAKHLQKEYESCKAKLDHCQLTNMLETSSSKMCQSRESVSMNAIRCINVLLMLWKEATGERVSLIDSLLSSTVVPSVMIVVKQELLKVLARYRSTPAQAILVLEMLTLATQRQFALVEALLLPDSAGSLLVHLQEYLQDDYNEPVFFWKVTALMAQLFLTPSKKQKSSQQLYNKTNFCMQLVRKFEAISKKQQSPVSLSKLGDDKRDPIHIFERVLVERQVFRQTCSVLALTKIVAISLQLYLMNQNQALACLRILLERTINHRLYVLDAEVKSEEERPVSEIEAVSLMSSLVYGMRNYLQDAQEEYYIGEAEMAKPVAGRMLQYVGCMKSSISAYCKKVRVLQAHATQDMLMLLLSTGYRGYLMETVQMDIKSLTSSQLLCHNHQPKMQAGFTDLFGRSLENSIENIRTLCVGILSALTNSQETVNHESLTALLAECLTAMKGTRLASKSIKEVVWEMLRNLNWVGEQPTMAEELVISSFSTAKLICTLLNLQYQLNIPSAELVPLAKVVENTLLVCKLDPMQRNVIMNMLMHLAERTSKVTPLLIGSLEQLTPQLFYNSCRIIAQYSMRQATEMCQGGLIEAYLKTPILSNCLRMEKLVFYTPDNERNPQHLCWIWTLQVMKCLVVYGDSKGYVINEVLKLVQFFQTRIYTLLSMPALLSSNQLSSLSYAFLDQLQATLSLLQVLFFQAESWLFNHRQFFENVLYILSHKTIDMFAPQLTLNRIFPAQTICDRKLQTTLINAQQTYEPQQINYSAGVRVAKFSGSYRPDMFMFTVEMKYLNCVGQLISVLSFGYPHSLFTEKYFDEPIDRQMNFTYQTLFWARLNRWIPLLQQYLQYTSQKWMGDSQLDNLLTLLRDSHHSVEVFAGNGYLASMDPFENRTELMDRLGHIAYSSVELAQAYFQLELRFRNRYFSVLAEDLQNFKSIEIQFIRRLAEKFDKRSAQKFVQIGLRFDKMRVL